MPKENARKVPVEWQGLLHIEKRIDKHSAFFYEMESRLLPLTKLENFLDSNESIFHYNSKANTFSAIQADYLLQSDFEGTPVYLFLAQRSGEGTQVCRSFFPKTDKDYTQGQPRYTLLKKEKHNIITGEIVVQYDRLTHSNSYNKISLFEQEENETHMQGRKTKFPE